MYESYWQLNCKPFEDTTDSSFYYPGASHQGTLLKLRYAVENHRAAALLTGPSGAGKTLLLQTVASQLGEPFSPMVHLVFPQMPPDQLLAYLAHQLSGETLDTVATSVDQSVRFIQQALARYAEAERHPVIAVDEAQLLDRCHALETLRLLLNFEQSGRRMFTLILSGQPALLPVLERMPELDERLAVKCLLRRLTAEESIGYVQHRLAAAGSQREIFDPSALEAIHQLASGVPRRINRLCDLALLVGYAEERANITAEQIEGVAEELVTVAVE